MNACHKNKDLLKIENPPYPFVKDQPVNISGSPVTTARLYGLTVTKGAENIFNLLHLKNFSAVWSFKEGVVIKSVSNRWVTRIDLEIHGKRQRYYLKCHNEIQSFSKKGCTAFFPDRIRSAGANEYRNIYDFRKTGLPTVCPVAYGQKLTPFRSVRSFLITEDFHPYISLESLLEKWPKFFMGKYGTAKKTRLLRAIAEYAKKMHSAGFNHRDFNATHILLFYKNPDTKPEVALFDLQRVDRNRCRAWWWPVKSLAELNYTLPSPLFGEADRLYLMKSYRQINTLGFCDRLLWLFVQLKTKKIERHQNKKHLKQQIRQR